MEITTLISWVAISPPVIPMVKKRTRAVTYEWNGCSTIWYITFGTKKVVNSIPISFIESWPARYSGSRRRWSSIIEERIHLGNLIYQPQYLKSLVVEHSGRQKRLPSMSEALACGHRWHGWTLIRFLWVVVLRSYCMRERNARQVEI